MEFSVDQKLVVELCVKSIMSIIICKRFKKTTTNKKIMHGLLNMFYFERKKIMEYLYSISLWAFVYHNVHILSCRFLNCYFFWKVLNTVTKWSGLDVARVLNPQYARGLHTLLILLKLLTKDNICSAWVQCLIIISELQGLISVNK